MLKVPRGYENPIKTNMEKTNSALDTSGNTSWILTMNQTYESIYIRVSLGKQDQLISKKRCRQSDSCNLTNLLYPQRWTQITDWRWWWWILHSKTQKPLSVVCVNSDVCVRSQRFEWLQSGKPCNTSTYYGFTQLSEWCLQEYSYFPHTQTVRCFKTFQLWELRIVF